ncbi:hypothetical protein RirG_008660 [Rhizophagus irregularis DAOM 197198w]|uniref:Uncharacterized protein n=1 Tax=Rhizophagus irregularis (strain DAOM 197198w) TaxID=1432141 RepID=A0A015KBH0_RHIIW|nr:hypothetical protein RirG_008660 [Rhizophagus irregularis DAOM 197198w]
MVNETSGENLLEFSKMLDETFGPTEYNTEEILPSKVDPSREKSTQALTLGPSPTMSETEIEPRPEQKKVKINVSLPQEHSVKEHNRETSSDSITTKDSHIFDVTKDISINSKEDTTEAPLRNPGFIEMRLKRKSIMGLEEDDSDCLTNSQPVTEELHIETDNPSHLFWVPAHLHPEIAPNEFRKWLKNHAKDGFNSGIGSLRRRKSTLSKQYIPSDVEDDEEETTDKKVEPEKKWTGFDWESYIGSDGNINPTSESTKLNILRRSLSLNLPPFMGGSISNPNDPNIFDRHSSPDVDSKVLVPRMSPALKRAARTKIRRNSVAGEQNPRRFSAHRRTRSTHVSSDKEKQSENNIVSKRPKQKSESLSVPQITIDKVDKKLNSSEIVDEPEEIQKDIELECIDVKDGAGPIRITLKDEVAPPEVSSQITPALHKTSSLASDENELSSELQVDQSDESNSLKVNTSKPGTFSTTISPSTSPNSTMGPGSSAEIAYKAPQYDMNQISQQYMTPPTSTNEFEEETVEDFGDNIDYHGEDEIQAHGYHHYNDEYLSDGTDGGYLDETNGRIESSHSGGLLHSSAEFDDNIGESSSGIKNNNYVRSPSPNGRSKSSTGRSKSPTGRPTSPNKKSGPPTPQRNSVPPSSKRKFINIPRNRSSSAGTRPLNPHNKISSKISTINSTADDEDDDVPLGLYKISSNTK